MENKLISVIIPIYNERSSIQDCLDSLKNQSYKPTEIIIVDDGSMDGSEMFATIKQNHEGTAAARNKGAALSRGEILVFVDADMIFDKDFIKNLIQPIIDKKTIGTFSKDEYLFNKNNSWARCWNINRELPKNKMHPDNYPNTQEVFRAVLKKEFDKVKGFDSTGYADDWTLSRKLNKKATAAPKAIFYHKNPESIIEVYSQARWFGKNEFLTGNLIRKIFNLLRFSFPLSIINGIFKSIKYLEPKFLIFKIIFDLAITRSIIGSFFHENKYK